MHVFLVLVRNLCTHPFPPKSNQRRETVGEEWLGKREKKLRVEFITTYASSFILYLPIMGCPSARWFVSTTNIMVFLQIYLTEILVFTTKGVSVTVHVSFIPRNELSIKLCNEHGTTQANSLFTNYC